MSALDAGDWDTARFRFESVLRARAEQTPEAWYGLGTALWWLGETGTAVRAQERAYSAFAQRPDPFGSALVAISLCMIYRASLGNVGVSRAWVGRLARLIDQHGLAPLRGWYLLCVAAATNDANDLAAAWTSASQALTAARASHDADLELCALSELGTALIQVGRVGDGVAVFDEAMAVSISGRAQRPESVVYAACRSLAACSWSFEIERATQWIRAAAGFTRRYGAVHLLTTCRIYHGQLLFVQGQWEESERQWRAALRAGPNAEPALHGQALAGLAVLRTAQGRLEEAAELVRGPDDGAAAVPRARLHLRRGEPEIAAAVLDGRLRGLGGPCAEAVPMDELRVEIDLAMGGVARATARATRLAAWAADTGCPAIIAIGARTLGTALLAAGDAGGAVRRLGDALDTFARLDLRYEAARTRLLLARAFRQHDRATAVDQGWAALAAFDQLTAAADGDEAAAFLRGLGVRVAQTAPRGAPMPSRREREVLALLEEGLTDQEIAARLHLTPTAVEHLVRSLIATLGVGSRTEAIAELLRERHGATRIRP